MVSGVGRYILVFQMLAIDLWAGVNPAASFSNEQIGVGGLSSLPTLPPDEPIFVAILGEFLSDGTLIPSSDLNVRGSAPRIVRTCDHYLVGFYESDLSVSSSVAQIRARLIPTANANERGRRPISLELPTPTDWAEGPTIESVINASGFRFLSIYTPLSWPTPDVQDYKFALEITLVDSQSNTRVFGTPATPMATLFCGGVQAGNGLNQSDQRVAGSDSDSRASGCRGRPFVVSPYEAKWGGFLWSFVSGLALIVALRISRRRRTINK